MKNQIKPLLRGHIFLAFLILLVVGVLISTILKDVPVSPNPGASQPVETGVITLLLHTPQRLPSLDLTLTLRTVTPTTPECRDCLETATVEVEQGGNVMTLEYKIGGFAGYMFDSQQAFGYDIILQKLQQDHIVVEYKKSQPSL